MSEKVKLKWLGEGRDLGFRYVNEGDVFTAPSDMAKELIKAKLAKRLEDIAITPKPASDQQANESMQDDQEVD